MAQLPRYVSRQLARTVSAKRLFKSNTPVFLPFYHTVSKHPLPHILNYPYRNEEEFERELDYFLKFFEPISLDDLITNSNQSEMGSKNFKK